MTRFCESQVKELPCGEGQLAAIAREYGTPFHIYSESGIRDNIRRLQAAFAWNRGFREYFAVKANPNPYLLDIMRSEGCGVDCSSLAELVLADAVGYRREDILFSSNNTTREEYAEAYRLGAIINSSRGIIAAYQQEKYAQFGEQNYADASRAAVLDMREDIAQALAAR